MEVNDKVQACLFQAIEEVNLHLGPEHQLVRSLDTIIIGEHGGLDSLGLLSFGVAVEQKIEDEFGRAIVLDWGELAAGAGGSPQTIGELRDHIVSLLGGANHG